MTDLVSKDQSHPSLAVAYLCLALRVKERIGL